MDDFGFKLIEKSNKKGFLNTIGQLLVKALPIFIKAFSVIGTIALLLVAGGIFTHNIEYLHHFFSVWPSILKDFVFGVLGGVLVLALITISKRGIKLFQKFTN